MRLHVIDIEFSDGMRVVLYRVLRIASDFWICRPGFEMGYAVCFGSSNYHLGAPYFLVNHAVSLTQEPAMYLFFRGHYGNQRSPVQV